MSGRLMPILLAVGLGVVSGVYIWNEPLQQATGLREGPKDTKPVMDWKTAAKQAANTPDAAGQPMAGDKAAPAA